MATAKPAPQPTDAATTTDTTDTATATPTGVATAPTAEDYTTSPTWGTGGRFVINSAGQRVPASASTTDQE